MPDWESRLKGVKADLVEAQWLQTANSLLEWDQQTYLPAKAGEYRANQIGFLAGEVHRRRTNPKLLESLRELGNSPDFSAMSPADQATVRQLEREFGKSARLTRSLVEELARASSSGQALWVEARRERNYEKFRPALERIVCLKQEQADLYGGGDRYEQLLDDYEPGTKVAELDRLIAELVAALAPLLQRLSGAAFQPNADLLRRHFPRAAQEQFGRLAATAIGFDFQRGRLDVTHHPFCTELGPDDCRILTRYDEQFFSTAFFGILHEAGHGLYEQGLCQEHYGLPPGQYCSLGIHESQSRLWENLVGRGFDFWSYFWPQFQTQFPDALAGESCQQFVEAINRVEPSLIRVEADEVSYNLHIVIRYQLEQAMICGELVPQDLPEAWRAKYKQYLGIEPADAAEGVLQDVHWSAGLFGYFPTYALGNVYASQLFAAADRALGPLHEQIGKGQFGPLLGWLRTNVHALGRSLSGPELIARATGKPPGTHDLLAHLGQRFHRIYRL